MRILWVLSVFLTHFAFADEAPLDPSYGPAHKVLIESNPRFFPRGFSFFDEVSRSDVAFAIGRQTPVKSQGGRGTCSIFSATGALESILKISLGEEFDFSENYLEYLVMTRFKANRPSEGSDTPWNFSAYKGYGGIFEEQWPYETYDWTKDDLDEEEAARRSSVCGSFEGIQLKSCHLTHRSPVDDPDREYALQIHQRFGLAGLFYDIINRQGVIRRILNGGQPMILSIDFFYGAWNHRLMVEYGIGNRDMDAWSRGEVGTPTVEDIKLSRAHSAGHSIVVVGYDDARRVYYFKNSWGQGSFGRDSKLLGEEAESTDGYGSISYDYAHNYGTFYRVGLK